MSRLRFLIASHLADIARSRGGVAAVEFALLLPILLVLVMATAEIVNAVDQRRKIIQLGRTLADLTAQGDSQSPLSDMLMSEILSSATPIMAPLPAANATIQISSIGIYQSNDQYGAYICSAYPVSGKRKVGKAPDIIVPKNFQRAGARYVLSEVTMPYQAILGTTVPKIVQGINLNFTWSEAVTWPVRSGTAYSGDPEIVMPNGVKCPQSGNF